MTEAKWPDFLSESLGALQTAVTSVPDDAWQRRTPCEQWNVAQVAQHAAGDQMAYALKITGAGGPEFDPFAPDGELESGLVERAVTASAAAWATVPVDAAEVAVPLPPFSLPAWMAAGAGALDAAVHAWDIAVATGQPSPLNPPLAAYLLSVAEQIVEPVRAYGMYAAALTPPVDCDEVDALLAYLGRRSDWAA
jgi:uncharacterized protein (TIGR03086 family)